MACSARPLHLASFSPIGASKSIRPDSRDNLITDPLRQQLKVQQHLLNPAQCRTRQKYTKRLVFRQRIHSNVAPGFRCLAPLPGDTPWSIGRSGRNKPFVKMLLRLGGLSVRMVAKRNHNLASYAGWQGSALLSVAVGSMGCASFAHGPQFLHRWGTVSTSCPHGVGGRAGRGAPMVSRHEPDADV
jgi:hypothetical protein